MQELSLTPPLRTTVAPCLTHPGHTSPPLFNHRRLMSGVKTTADRGKGQSPGGDTHTPHTDPQTQAYRP